MSHALLLAVATLPIEPAILQARSTDCPLIAQAPQERCKLSSSRTRIFRSSTPYTITSECPAPS